MTYDVVVLTQEMPDTVAVLDGLGAVGDDLRLDLAGRDGLIRLCDVSGGTLLSIEAPVGIRAPGEAERLLGERAAGLEPPLWRVRMRAAEREGADDLARRFARDLVRRLGGMVWDGDEETGPVIHTAS
ncbi:hypothetical protein GCM10023085_29610 [Actinomadura viridis]|uniref:Uncharacterized protein n=1 Tax=Actinomadura viridis TaxID=58110 RepID=A0A931DGG9_9ACTN|nr:hypothetical protein [Actinomadura viridis]MBG6087056.1 hypothetical protein [Actinomadura viridis]